MREFRRKQRKLKKIMNLSIFFSAVFIFLYIGAEPYVAALNSTAAVVCGYLCDILIIAVMAVLFYYYSKYGKSDSFLSAVELELSDAGYYFTSRKVTSSREYADAVFNDLQASGYFLDKNIEIDEFDFFARGFRQKEFFYIAVIDELDKNDVLAYLDCVIQDLTVRSLKRKGSAVILFVTDKAGDDAVALSKMITPIGKKEQLKIALAIAEVSASRCYFLGNAISKCQQMIVHYAMNCELPIKKKYIGTERLSFQDELEEHMKSFNIRDFKDGNFYAH